MLEGWRTAALLVAATAVGAAVAASPAHAQPSSRLTAKDRQAASALFAKGAARAEAGDHEGAIDLYRKAYEIAPDPALLTNIGAELEKSGKPEEALRYFCTYLELAPRGNNMPFAKSHAKALQIRLGNKSVDDDNVCAPPKPVPREPERPPEPPPVTGTTPPEELPDEPRRSSTLSYVGVGAGIASLAAFGVGIYAGVKARKISDQISHHPVTESWESDIRSIESRGQRYENLQIGALIVGGSLAVTTAVVFYLSSGSRAHSKPTVAGDLSITPTANGFAVLGSF